MWQTKNNVLYQKFEFNSFDEAIEFIEKIAAIARRQNHHPRITNSYNTVELELSTHTAGYTVTDKDEAFSKEIDKLMHESTKSKDKPLKRAKLYTDGGSRGNPGPSALGYVIYDTEDNIIKKDSFYLGITTNNQAEYQALKEGVEAAQKLGVRELDIYLDSLLVVNQMKGLYKVKNRDLWPIHQSIKDMIKEFSHTSFTHVPRALNAVADSMVNACLDAAENSA